MAQSPLDSLVHRFVGIPCPSGKHKQSLVAFRNHRLVVMFCIPCEYTWMESTQHPLLAGIPPDETGR